MSKVVFYTEDEVDRLREKVASQEREIKALESLRPHWAQGYSSDSLAAQASTAALSDFWDLLGVDNQTEGVQKLKTLLGTKL